MSLLETINTQLATSMKEGEPARTAVLRLLKNSLQNEQIKVARELSDDEALRVVAREAKQRKDSIAAYRDGGRDELAAEEEAELGIIQEFLPTQLGEGELQKIIDDVVAEIGADGVAQMGVVIGAVMKRTAGAADGGMVSRLVKQKLTA